MTIRTQFVKRPRSQAIADFLNRYGFQVCKHGRSPCYVFCGVRVSQPVSELELRRRGSVGGQQLPWEPIPQPERKRWLHRVLALGPTLRRRRNRGKRHAHWMREKAYRVARLIELGGPL